MVPSVLQSYQDQDPKTIHFPEAGQAVLAFCSPFLSAALTRDLAVECVGAWTKGLVRGQRQLNEVSQIALLTDESNS